MNKKSPNVFISYCWTNEKHVDWVLDLANKLFNDGVNVIIDRWNLKPDQDVYSFMKSNILSNNNDKVLIICDKEYCTNANSGKGAVGYEANIMISQIYKEASQEKLIPVVTEVDAYNKPYLPNFLRSKLFIDMSTQEKYERNYELLLRNIYRIPKATSLEEINLDKLNEYEYSRIKTRNFQKSLLTLQEKTNMNFGLNEYFIGREEQLKRLESVVKHLNDANFEIQVITGTAGVGKTQLAVEYIYSNHKYYDLIWWFNADNEESIIQGYTTLAEKLKISSQDKENELSNTLYFLESSRKRWLLVFDNADNIKYKQIRKYIPNLSGFGHIIITSRNEKLSDLLRCERIHLSSWSKYEALSYLDKTINLRKKTVQDHKMAEELTNILENSPLLIKQAATYINNEEISIKEYIDILKDYNIILDGKSQNISIDDTISSMMYKITLIKINSEDEIAGLVAKMFSFCSRDGIPWKMLFQKLKINDSSVTVLSTVDEFKIGNKVWLILLSSRIVLESETNSIGNITLDKLISNKVKKAISVLQKYQLIRAEENLIYMDKTVQNMIKVGLKEEKREKEYFKLVLGILSKSFIIASEISNTDDIAFNERLQPHILDIIENSICKQIYSEDRVRLLYKFGLYLNYKGLYKQGLVYMKQGLEIARKIDYKNAEILLVESIGMSYRNMGKFEEALKVFHESLILYREIDYKYGEAVQLANIGFLNLNNANLDEAENSLLKSLEINKKIGNKSEEAKVLGNIALIYLIKGKLNGAFQYLNLALEIFVEIDDIKNKANILGNIGLLYHEKFETDIALKYIQSSLKICREISYKQGEAVQLGNMGLIHGKSNIGEFDLALECIQNSREIYIKIGNKQGEANQLCNIGVILGKSGEFNHALESIRNSREVYRSIGHKQGEVLTLKITGRVCFDMGNFEQALEFYEQALQINIEIGYRMGEAGNCKDIGIVYSFFGNYDQSINYFESALMIYKQIGHLSEICDIVEKIGLLYERMKILERAIEYFKMSYEISTKMGQERKALNQLAYIGKVYYQMNNFDEAFAYYGKALEIGNKINYAGNVKPILDNANTIYLHMADIYLHKDDYYNAIEYYNKSVIVDDTNIEAWLGLEKAYLKIGQYESASEILQNLAKSKEKKLFDENVKSKINISKVVINDLNFFKNIEWDVQPHINILLGRNGYGKTHLFRLLLCLMQRNSAEVMKFFVSCGENAQAKIYVKKENEVLYIHRMKTIFEKSVGIVPLLGIPSVRVIDKSVDYINYISDTEEIDLKLNGAYNFIHERKDENRIKRFLYELGVTYLNSNKTFEAEIFSLLEDIVFELTGNEFKFRKINVLDNGAAFQIYVDTENSVIPLPFQKVSEGTLSVLSIFGLIYNFLKSMSINQREIINGHGIVFIDEIDAHLHPEWQRKIVSLLRKKFPNVQFFITAHSPLVVSGCRENEVSVLRKKEKGDFSLHQFKQNFIGWNVSELFKQVFDVEETDETYLYYSALYPFKGEIENEIAEIEKMANLKEEEMKKLEKLYGELRYMSEVKFKCDEKEDLIKLNNKLISLEIENKKLRKSLQEQNKIL